MNAPRILLALSAALCMGLLLSLAATGCGGTSSDTLTGTNDTGTSTGTTTTTGGGGGDAPPLQIAEWIQGGPHTLGDGKVYLIMFGNLHT